MNTRQKNIAIKLREENYSFLYIADQLNVSANTVKSYCRRHNIVPVASEHKGRRLQTSERHCRYCGEAFQRKRIDQAFCSMSCQQQYWKEVKHKRKNT